MNGRRLWVAAALLGAAVLGVALGLLFAPSDRVLARTIEVGRRAALIHVFLADARAFAEFTPWAEADPGLTFESTGAAAAVGQKLAWTTPVPGLGVGALTLAESVPGSRLRYTLDAGACPGALIFEIAEGLTLSTVTWREERRCGGGLGALPARLRLWFGAGRDRAAIDLGLQRLRTLVEELPNADLAALPISETEAPALEFIYGEGSSSLAASDIVAAETAVLQRVATFLERNAILRAGPAVAVTETWDEAGGRYVFRAGYPFAGPAPIAGPEVQVGRTAPGRVVRARYAGPREGLAGAYALLDAYMRARRLSAAGAPWQRYPEADGVAGAGEPTVIEIVFPVIDSRAR